MKPTLAQLEAALRVELMKPETALKYVELPSHYGDIEWKGSQRIIRIDPFQCVLPTLVHELFHQTMRDPLAQWGQLEEVVLEAAEMAVTSHINNNPRKTRWWRETVRAKAPLEDGWGADSKGS